jgi:hypothetical protein
MTKEKQTPRRETFDAEFLKLVEQFVSTAVDEIPELDGITVIPVWRTSMPQLPSGYFRPSAPEMSQDALVGLMMRAAQQNIVFGRRFFEQMLTGLMAIDKQVSDRVAQWKAEIDNLTQKEGKDVAGES